MATAGRILCACPCRRWLRHGGAPGGVEHIGGEAGDEQDLAAEHGNGQRIAARGSVRLDWSHDSTGSVTELQRCNGCGGETTGKVSCYCLF